MPTLHGKAPTYKFSQKMHEIKKILLRGIRPLGSATDLYTHAHNLPGGFGNVNISIIVNKDSENFSVSTFRCHGDSCGMHLEKNCGIFLFTRKPCSILDEH